MAGSALEYLEKVEWSMGNGQCPECHGLGPLFANWPEIYKVRGHGKGCLLAAAISDCDNTRPPQQPAGDWRPIDSAPKDGLTQILLYGIGQALVGIRPIGCPDDAASDLLGTACYPTHWMPLPQPPGQEKAGE